jgi:hypothetical protein|tara:strand:+ start:43 stop:471 length:429 start_codon:yes stop_codon:yes gene_type:complete
MTLVNTRAAFEKAVTDAVSDANPKVKMVYDNVPYITPSKSVSYVVVSVNFGQSTIQNQGAASDYYVGFVQCSIYVPKNKGTAALASIGEVIIDGLTSINASDYVDTYSCKPRVREIVGPGGVEDDDESHYLGVITCQFSANA